MVGRSRSWVGMRPAKLSGLAALLVACGGHTGSRGTPTETGEVGGSPTAGGAGDASTGGTFSTGGTAQGGATASTGGDAAGAFGGVAGAGGMSACMPKLLGTSVTADTQEALDALTGITSATAIEISENVAD